AVDELRAAQSSVHVELTVDGPDDGVWDGHRLARVLTNLLRNAIQHGAEGRPITVKVFSHGSDLRVLTVHNEGAAIPPEVLHTLFQPMVPRVTSAPSEGNMGLGLFVCKEIVSAHGGSIVITSDATGTECRVELPAQPPHKTPTA